MTGCAKKFNKSGTMSLRVNNNQLLKDYNKIWEKVEKLMKINFESKPVYGDDDKYTKTKTKIYAGSVLQIFMIKNAERKSTMQVFINNNARFCY